MITDAGRGAGGDDDDDDDEDDDHDGGYIYSIDVLSPLATSTRTTYPNVAVTSLRVSISAFPI